MLSQKEIRSSSSKNQIINRRVFLLAAAKIVLFGGMTYRLFNLQISDREKYLLLSDKNRLREWKTPPQRGIITDYFNNVIAENDRVFQLHVNLEEVKDFNNLIVRLKTILNLNNNNLRYIYKKVSKLKPWDTLVVSDNLTWEQFSRLNLYLHELQGAEPVLSSARNYPYDKDLVHVVGYVGEASAKDIMSNEKIQSNYVPGLKVGKSGLEKSLEGDLIGRYGIKRYEVNAYGKRISQINQVESIKGKKVTTTIDVECQQLAQNLLKGQSGSICAMDIYTGEIIAMASSPTYDPNKFTHGINIKDWKEIKNNPLKPLINKSLAGLYSPGSIIKPLVALAALEFDIIKPNMTVKCEEVIELYGQKYHCWKKKGHGFMRLRNAIKQSCDIYFYEVARLLGVDRLSILAKRYGLGSKVLGDLYIDEKIGIVPSTKWKLENLELPWYLGETIITGIGQGYIQSTPLQLCLMTAQLANGGYKIKPQIILDDELNYEDIRSMIKLDLEKYNLSSNPKKLIELNKGILQEQNIELYKPMYRNPENVKFVLEAMFASTNELYGTSFNSRHEDEKYQFAGKTGTSQVRRITEAEREADLKISEIEYKNRDHALYVAFAPYKDPRYAISVLIEHGGSGSKVAAPIANKFIKKIIDRHKFREFKRIKVNDLA